MIFAICNPRICFAAGFLACCGMLATGAYLQLVVGLEPCPLCISQRLAILSTGLVFLIGAIHGSSHRMYAGLATLTSLIGAGISTRHVWLQHLPKDQVPECGPGLEYVFKNFPLSDTIKMMLSGTGECAEIDASFLGLSLPGWTLVAFLILASFSLTIMKLNSKTVEQ